MAEWKKSKQVRPSSLSSKFTKWRNEVGGRNETERKYASSHSGHTVSYRKDSLEALAFAKNWSVQYAN
jgi:hypothetical protein